MRKYLNKSVLFCSLMIFPAVLSGQLQQLETHHLVLINPSRAHDFIMPYMGQCFENALQYHQRFFNYEPSEKVTLFMQDFWDYGNAGATAIPVNYIRIGIAPLSYTYETSPANERINHTMNHELVHIVASDKASGNDNFYRKMFFGKVAVSPDDPLSMFYSYLTNPRRYSPRWYHEGIAVFMETWMAGGIGRALGSYDEMVFRTKVRDGSYFYDVIGLESEGTAIDFQVGVNSYLYGTRFMSFLAHQYGPDKLIDWVGNTEGRNKYFATDFRNHFPSSLDEEWGKWIEWEKDFQKKNLDAIRRYPTTETRALSERALGSVSRGYYDRKRNKLYVAILYPAESPHIAAIDVKTGEMEKICPVKGAGLYYVTSLAYDPEAEILYFSSDNGSWRDLNRVDVNTGETEYLAKDMRTGDLAFNRADNSLWGIRHYNGISTIVRIEAPYDKWDQILSWPYGKDMYDIDISPDGKYLTGALTEISGRQYLIKMNLDSLRQGDESIEILYDFENSLPANFNFSEDGRYLFGSSYYSGVSNIFRYDLQEKDIVALSNCESGFFRPVPVSDDSLIIFRYTGEGFVPSMIANKEVQHVSSINFLGNEIVGKYPVVRDWIAGSPADINMDSLTVYKGSYNAINNIGLNSIYPIVEGYKDYGTFGLRADFMDLMGVAAIKAKVSYTPNPNLASEERFHAGFDLRYWEWKLKFTYNHADFYDLFGPTKTSRKGYSFGLDYDKSLLYEKPTSIDLNVNVTGYADLDRLPYFQNVATPVQEFLTFGASLDYRHLERTLGAVSEEKGYELGISSYNYYANADLFPHLTLKGTYGFLLPLDHSSLWFRGAVGVSDGDRNVAFSNFYFGGFGNNWIDHKSVRRFRDVLSFPGVELNRIEAQNFFKLMVEWPLPPYRFRRFGFTNLYLNWTRLSLFSSGITEDVHDEEKRSTVVNFGAQLDFKMVIFTYMSSTLSFGYGGAFFEGQRISNEFMISLKIL